MADIFSKKKRSWVMGKIKPILNKIEALEKELETKKSQINEKFKQLVIS